MTNKRGFAAQFNIEQGLLDPPQKKIAFVVKRTRFSSNKLCADD